MKTKLFCLYLCFSSILFVLIFPFLYVGFPGTSGYNVLVTFAFQSYSPPTKISVWFASNITIRIILTLLMIIAVIFAEFKVSTQVKTIIQQTVLWIGFGYLCINYLGLVCLFV